MGVGVVAILRVLADAAEEGDLVVGHAAPRLVQGAADLFAGFGIEGEEGVGVAPEHVHGRAFAGEIKGDEGIQAAAAFGGFGGGIHLGAGGLLANTGEGGGHEGGEQVGIGEGTGRGKRSKALPPAGQDARGVAIDQETGVGVVHLSLP